MNSGSPFSLGFQYFQGAKGGNSGTMVNIRTTTRVTCLARCDGRSSGIETHLWLPDGHDSNNKPLAYAALQCSLSHHNTKFQFLAAQFQQPLSNY
jgi:hypothetical protein